MEEKFHHDIDLTVSAGVTCIEGRAGVVDSLVEAADDALYSAKALGKNRVVTKAHSVVGE